jgi:hypothetical protein
MFKIGDIVVRDLSSLNYSSQKYNNAVGRIITEINSSNCHKVEIIDPNGTGYKLGAKMWWSVQLMQLSFPREPDWEI